MRRRVALAELEAERDPDAAAALAVLTESRLVTVDEGTVEVAHEALLREWPRLRDWLAEDAEGRRLHQHLIHAARGMADLRPRSGRALPRRPACLGARLGDPSHEPELNELEREFLEESRAASEREAERQRRTNRRLRTLLAGVGVLLAAALVAGVIALSERQGARSAATSETAQRLGAEALTEDRLDEALMLANTGVALDDSLATRSSLLSTLLRSPAALGVLSGDAGATQALALSPDGSTLAAGDGQGQGDRLRHRDEAANRRSPAAGRGLVARLRPPRRRARDPREQHARAHGRRPCRSSTRALCGCRTPSRSAPIRPPPDRRTSPPPSTPRTGEAWWSAIRPGITTTRCQCSCGVSTPAPAPRSDRPSASPPGPPRSR